MKLIKSRSANRRPQQASVLMVTLFMVSLVGFFVFAYLNLVRTQRGLVARSQAWNTAMALAEAGLEEALAQINLGAPATVVDRTANGWGTPVAGFYGPMSRTFTNMGSYSVIISTDAFPIIYATGYVSVASIPATLTRVLRLTTANPALFSVGMATKLSIDMKGNNVNTDSFDSSNSQLSTNGQYDPTKTSTNGDIASVGGVVNVGNANINGEVLLGPTASESQLNNGYVSGGVTNDFNVSFPDVLLPGASPLPAINLPVTIDGTTYDYAFATSGYYQIDNLSGSIYVAPGANVTLLLTGTATSQYIRVASAGGVSGNLAIYMNGPTFTLSGNDTIDSGNALNFQYYGTTSNTQVKFTGNASFTGTIYAPEAAFSMGGGGSSTYDFVGSSVTLSAAVNGHYNFHYDQNLSNAGPRRGFVANSWQEL
jgi:hypothetical protein